MANIEDRVVSLTWESAKFEQGVAGTLTSLQKLNDSLKKVGTDNGLENIEKSASKIHFSGLGSAIDKLKSKLSFGKEASEGLGNIEKASDKVTLTGASTAVDKLQDKVAHVGPAAQQSFATVEQAAGKVHLSGLSDALDGITAKFGAMQVAGIAALGTIVSKATTAGMQVGKSLSVAPILTGFREYELKLGSIQTILANTEASGATLKDVNKTLQELNHYADKTIYNFGQMTKNIGTFTAAGVDLETSAASIKGIANLAALSGSNSEQASRAMYQLSQAIAAGRVSLMDWKSVENAGMGGAVFQRQLAQTAVAMGVLDEKTVALSGDMKNVKIDGENFRTSIMAKPGEESWLTTGVLTNALKTFTGDLKDAELAAMGFNDEQIKAIQKQAKTATDAATKVKTLTQLLDTAKESAGSGWAETWEIVFGNFKEAKSMWSDASDALGGFIQDSAEARNKVLADWKELGGRTLLIESVRNVFQALGQVIKPIKDAFRDLFPAKTGKDLYGLTFRLREFTEALKIGPETAEDLKRTFKGVFAVFSIGKQVLSGIFDVVKTLFSELGKGSGGVLDFTGSIGDLLVSLDSWLKKGDRLKDFFTELGEALKGPINLIGEFKDDVVGLFDGVDGSDAQTLGDSLGTVNDHLAPLADLAEKAKDALGGLADVVSGILKIFQPLGEAIVDAVGDIGKSIADAIANTDMEGIFQAIQTTLIGGLVLSIKKAIDGGLGGSLGLGSLVENLNNTFGTLQSHLVAMQQDVKANAILKIAVALGILTASVVLLSGVDSKKLATAMTGMAVGLGQLLAAMNFMSSIGGKAAAIQAPLIAGAIIALAVAMNILALAVKQFSTLEWEELAKGLAGLTGALGVVTAMAGPLGLAGPGLIRASLGLIAMGIALRILAESVDKLGSMEWEQIGRGLVGILGTLIVLADGMKIVGPKLLLIGPGLILVGTGMGILSGAILALGSMDMATLGKGIGAIAASLVALGLAMGLMPPTMILSAAALVVVSGALVAIAGAVGILGNMNLGTLAKGIGAIGVMLIALAVGLTAMIAALPGAAALLVAAGALAILAPVIGILGNMKFSTMAKGLGFMVASIVALSAAAIVAAPGLALLAASLVGLGIGILAVGAGVNLLAKGLRILGSEGAKGVGVVIAAITGLIAILPSIVIDFLKGVVQIAKGIAEIAPQIVDSLVKIINSLLDVIIKASPKFALAATAIITAILRVIAQNYEPIIRTGFEMLLALLDGMASNIGEITRQVSNIVIRFLDALAAKMPTLVASGAKVLAAFLRGIANNLGKVMAAATDVVVRFLNGVANHIKRVVKAGANIIVKFIEGIGDGLGNIVNAGARMLTRLMDGVANKFDEVVKKATDVVIRFANTIGNRGNIARMVDAGFKCAIAVIRGVADGIRKDENIEEVMSAAAELGLAIVEGVVRGLGSLAKRLGEKLISPVKDAVGFAKNIVGAKSPATVFIELGQNIVEGMTIGLASFALTLDQNIVKPLANMVAETNGGKRLGRFLAGEFAAGLIGSEDDIENAFDSFREKLREEEAKIRDQVQSDNQKLRDLLNATNKDKRKIAAARRELAQDEAILKATKGATSKLIKDLGDEKNKLRELAKQYEDTAAALEEAKGVLAEATRTRDDAFKSLSSQFSTLPAIDDDEKIKNKAAAFKVALQAQISATENYLATLERLRALGLSDRMYQKLLDEGVKGQAFADSLIAGGQVGINELNKLDQKLVDLSTKLAHDSATHLYQAGVNAAQGLVNGLQAQLPVIQKQMTDIALAMVATIKKALKIKSPSQVFAEIGKLSAKGMAQGLKNSSKLVGNAAADVGDEAVSGLVGSLSKVGDILNKEIDPDLTITPILDLSNVERGAKKLADLTNVTPITAAASYGQASAISTETTSQSATEAETISGGSTILQFEQNNYSPKALSEAEVYRQTRNQLSQAKDALGV